MEILRWLQPELVTGETEGSEKQGDFRIKNTVSRVVLRVTERYMYTAVFLLFGAVQYPFQFLLVTAPEFPFGNDISPTKSSLMVKEGQLETLCLKFEL